MNFNFRTGMAAATGYMQGRDEALARDNAAADRLAQQRQREFRDGQQAHEVQQRARTVAEQGREDQLRTDLTAIPAETTTDHAAGFPQVDDAGNAMPSATKTTKMLQDQQLRQAAAAFGRAGDFGKALELHGQADKISWDRSARKFQELQASASDPRMTALQAAELAAEIYSQDPFGGKVTKVQAEANGGVTIGTTNRETGATTSKTYATKEAMLESLHGYFSPATFAALQAKRQSALLEVSKPKVLRPGDKLVSGGVEIASNGPPKGYEDVEINGATVRRKITSKVEDPDKLLNDAWENVATKGNAKLEPAQYARGNRIAKQLVAENPGKVPVAMAVEVALSVALNPELAVPSIDKDTGRILTVYRHPEKGPFVIERSPPPDANPEMMKKAVAIMLKEQDPKVQAEMQAAAFEPNGSERLANAVFAEYDAEIAQQVKANPTQAKAIQERAEAVKASSRQNLDRKLKMIKGFGEQPKAAGPGFLEKVRGFIGMKSGGLPLAVAAAVKYRPDPASPAGRAQAQRDQARQQSRAGAAQQSAAQQKLSEQFQRDAKKMAPLDLVRRYDDLRMQLPTADAARLQQITSQLR